MLSGKNTGRLGVVPMKISAGGIIDVTDLERTLVDLAVRPVYGGGVGCVLEAYRRAQPRVSVHKIVTTLRRLDHMYPIIRRSVFTWNAQALTPKTATACAVWE